MCANAWVSKAVRSGMSFHERLRVLAALAVAAVGCVLAAAALAAPANAASLPHFRSAVGRAERATAPGPPPPAAAAQFRTVDFPGAAATRIDGVNNGGVLAGSWSSNSTDFSGNSFGFIEFPSGQSVTFDYPGTTGVTEASNINDLRTVVGNYLDNSGVLRGFVRSRFGEFTPLDDPAGAGGTITSGINDRGVIVGQYFDTVSASASHGFVYDDGTFTTLDYPGAASTALGNVNNSGAIVGSYTDASGINHGFLYEHGTFTTIDAPDAGTASGEGTFLAGISSNGVIAVQAVNDTGVFGWLLSHGRFSSLNDPNAAASSISEPLDISSSGRYASGVYVDASGAGDGFVATLRR